ncbi:tyrosine-type recombinase/integrase [Nonomuraea sp. NPDC003804]|uniref:tyrosine-type recombinase/integrase n=1 Tax=Nonomuraea sp. NPDC003804 TaxID=3154547 RepID=UPI0033B4C915
MTDEPPVSLVSGGPREPAGDPLARLESDLPHAWRGEIIGPDLTGHGNRPAGSFTLDLRDLPDRFRLELAWMAHWQLLDGASVMVRQFGRIAHLLRSAARCGYADRLPASLASWSEADSSRLHALTGHAETGRMPSPSTMRVLHSNLRYAHLALHARLHDGPWWELDRWLPRCDPRIPLRAREPLRAAGCQPGNARIPWVREAIKWVLGMQLESGEVTWSTLVTNRMPALLRLDRWMGSLPDPAAVARDIADAPGLAASFRAWNEIPANRTTTGREPTAQVAVSKVNTDLLVIAGFLAFMLDNPDETRRMLPRSPWQALTPLHPGAWTRQIRGRRRKPPAVTEDHYLDDHTLTQLTACLPALGAPAGQPVPVTCGGRVRELTGHGQPQVMRMLLLQILTGRRASEILLCAFDCLSPATGRALQAAEGEHIARFHYAQSKIGQAPDTILVDAEVVAIIEEQRRWVLERFGTATPFLFPQRKANRNGGKPFPRGTYAEVLAAFSEQAQITDSAGRPVRLSHTHRFRHSRLTRLAELGLPIHVLQRYAGHANPTMSMHYIARRDEHAEQAFLATRKFRADASPVAFTREDHDTLHLFQRADRILPHGYCLLPPLQSCDKGNACLSCGVFVTDDSHQEVLQQQLDQTDALVERTRAAFAARHGRPMPEDNVWLAERLRERQALLRLLAVMRTAPGRALQGVGAPTTARPEPVPVQLSPRPPRSGL